MKKEIKNLPASIHERLRSLAKHAGRPFQEYFYYYAIERFLFRLSTSQYRERFVLKGGLMFFGWGIPLRRSTRDIDMQGIMVNTIEELVAVVKEICLQEVEPDGMRYDPDTIRGERIIETAKYPGIRVNITGYLGNADVNLQVDVSFANVITPDILVIEYPGMLDKDFFTLHGYPIETSIAEKFQAMVALQELNNRMKDFYDIWLLAQQVSIPGNMLVRAIRATFNSRQTRLPDQPPVALSDEFARLRQPDWERFLRRSLLGDGDLPDFGHVIEALRQFLWPVLQAASSNAPFAYEWKPGAGWQE